MKIKTNPKKERDTFCLTKAELLDYVFNQSDKDKLKIENHLETFG